LKRILYLSLALLSVLLACSKDTIKSDTTDYRFLLTINAEEGGKVSSNGGVYDKGASVTFSATADEGYFFTGWSNGSSENPLTIVMNTDQNITALFKKLDYTLFLEVLGQGEIFEEVISIEDNSTKVKLTAIPEQGWKFIRWKGGLISYETEIVIDITEPLALKASFVQSNQILEVSKDFFNIEYSLKNYLLYEIGGGKRYFETNEGQYLVVSSDYSDSHLLKKIDSKWNLIDVFESPVSGLAESEGYMGMGPVNPISQNEYIASSVGENRDTDPSTWGAYIYKGKIENDNLSYQKITDFKDYYSGLAAYGDITGDGLGDIFSSGWIFINNGDETFSQHNITTNTETNQGESIEQFKTNLALLDLERYHQLSSNLSQQIADLYPGGRDEIIMSFIDVSDKVSEDESVPRGDVIIYEYDNSTQQFEVVFELPRRTVGEVETSEGIEVYDVNNDGINDILLSINSGDSANQEDYTPPFEVWLGNTDKTFTKHFEFERQSFVGGAGYYVMDVNNDGFLDITLLPVGDNADWIQNWCLDCSYREEQGLPIKDGLKLQNAIWLNDGTGRFNVLNKELTIQNSFVTWLLPYMKDGNLNYIGAEYNYIDGEIMEIEVLNIEIKSNFFN